MARNYRKQSLKNTFKDYMVPIIGGFLILILIYSFFRWDSPESNSTVIENQIWYQVIFRDINTAALIEYETGKKEEILNNTEIFKWEKLIIKEGIASVNIWSTSIKLNKLWELKLNQDGWYSLFSSDAWFSGSSPLSINLRYGNVTTQGGSILSLSQNEVSSTVYVVSGTAQVSNLSGQSTLVGKWQKISIPRADASKDDIDISLLKSDFDNYFLWSDWFLENDGPNLLSQTEETTTEETTSEGGYISFSGLRDEMRVDTSSIDISGTILNEEVQKITINNIDVSINEDDNTFSLENIILNKEINDLVVKIYDINGILLSKEVYTVNTSNISSISSESTSPQQNWSSNINSWGTTYNIDATQFWFTAPSTTGKFSTVGSEITIRGITTASGITKVEVNGFELSSFNGSTWRYHAFSRFDTLADGTNQYKVDYFGENWNIVYTDYFTIVKKEAGSEPVQVATPSAIISDIPEVEDTIISDEADL